MKLPIAILLVLVGLILGFKGKYYCMAFTFNWEGNVPKIQGNVSKGWSAAWKNQMAKDELYQTISKDYVRKK